MDLFEHSIDLDDVHIPIHIFIEEYAVLSRIPRSECRLVDS